jgi:hypothetical protein
MNHINAHIDAHIVQQVVDMRHVPLASSACSLFVWFQDEQRMLSWDWANLEYGCSAQLHEVSLAHWNQDEEFGGFGGGHAMVVGGYSQVREATSS